MEIVDASLDSREIAVEVLYYADKRSYHAVPHCRKASSLRPESTNSVGEYGVCFCWRFLSRDAVKSVEEAEKRSRDLLPEGLASLQLPSRCRWESTFLARVTRLHFLMESRRSDTFRFMYAYTRAYPRLNEWMCVCVRIFEYRHTLTLSNRPTSPLDNSAFGVHHSNSRGQLIR